jgi:hypothetical protein
VLTPEDEILNRSSALIFRKTMMQADGCVPRPIGEARKIAELCRGLISPEAAHLYRSRGARTLGSVLLQRFKKIYSQISGRNEA